MARSGLSSSARSGPGVAADGRHGDDVMTLRDVHRKTRIDHATLEEANPEYVHEPSLVDAVACEDGKRYEFMRVTGGWECLSVRDLGSG